MPTQVDGQVTANLQERTQRVLQRFGLLSAGENYPFGEAPGTAGTPLGRFPTQVRNQYRGPGFFDTDFSVNKNFKIRERMTFTVGANIYNILNHPNFQNPHTGWSQYNSQGNQYPLASSPCSSAGSTGGSVSCGNINGQAAPPTGPYGSFFQRSAGWPRRSVPGQDHLLINEVFHLRSRNTGTAIFFALLKANGADSQFDEKLVSYQLRKSRIRASLQRC